MPPIDNKVTKIKRKKKSGFARFMDNLSEKRRKKQRARTQQNNINDIKENTEDGNGTSKTDEADQRKAD